MNDLMLANVRRFCIVDSGNSKKGIIGYLWGARIWVQESIQNGEILFYGENDPNRPIDFVAPSGPIFSRYDIATQQGAESCGSQSPS
jgi:hypothetical protein